MTTDQSQLRVYSDRTYAHTTMVRHQGTSLAFAMDDRRRIVYTVLDLSSHDEKRGELDAAHWSENPVELPFPDEIVKVGYSVIPATAMPRVKRGGRLEAGADEELEPSETDRFLSTTARLTAAAPFQVLSDGTHVVVLRQAVGATHPDSVFVLSDGGSSGDTSRTDFTVDLAGAKVPVAADTLLCDRFLLVGGRLKPVTEVRFRRSRHKSEPDSAKDSLGASDMDGKPFHEPTQELAFVRNLTEGRFTGLLTPTAVQGQQRWQVFAYNAVTKRIDGFNVEQGEDGLFNTQGTRYWTSPDPQYQSSVFEREPGTCPFTGKDLVPVAPDHPLAETALQFGGSGSVDLGTAERLKFQGKSYTIEAWVKPAAPGGPVVSRWAGAGQGGFQLRISNTGQVVLEHSGGTPLIATQTIPANTWAHVAASFNGTVAALYVNGTLSTTAVLAYPTDGAASLRIGSAQSGGSFNGVIDEVRIWNRDRTQKELAQERGYRLIGNEPGLTAYYRLDEGSGTKAYDQSDSALHGTLTGTGASWVTSQAPVSDHPGVRRDSFTLEGREVVSGISASLYYQQEEAGSGYQDSAKPAKRQARVLLACATRPSGNTAAEAQIATVDFGVGIDGRLAAVPDVIALAEIGRPVEQNVDLVTAQENRVTALEQEATAITTEINTLNQEKATLKVEVASGAVRAGDSTDPYKWAFWMTSSRVTGYYRHHYLGANSSDPIHIFGIGSGTDVRLALWQIPGATGRYGNSMVALVNLDANYVVFNIGGHTDWDRHGGVFNQLNLTDLPDTAKWYVKGSLSGSFTLQHVATGRWLDFDHVYPNESSATPVQLAKAGLAIDLTKIARLAALPGLIDQRTQDLAAKQAEITLARDRLAQLTNGLLGAADLVLPVPHLAIDAGGLSSAGALLGFARTASTPYLMDSAAGRLVLYFRGANGQFFAAYLDTTAVRGVQQLTGGGVTTLFTARDPGVDLSGMVIRVAECRVNNTVVPGLCDLTITRGTETETFTRLPRKARDLAAAVNGASDEPLQIGTVASVSGDQVRLTVASTLAVPAPSYVQIGADSYLVNTDTPVGATTIRVLPAPPAGLTAGTKVSLVRYDSDLAAASSAGASLTRGSRWIAVSADQGERTVPDGTASARVTGYGSRWRGDSPGRAFTFDSTASHRLTLPTAQLDQVTTTAGDLTAEAWIKPGTVPAAGARILHLNRDTTKVALALAREPGGGGMVLNGTDIAMAINGADPTGTDFTIECWLKRTTGRTVTDTIVAIGANGLTMGYTSDGKFRFGFGTGAAAQTLTTASTYPDGDWHHWAVTFHRTTKVQVIYRDGVEVARRTATTLPSGTNQLIVGRTDDGSSVLFSGRLAELRTWSTVRSAADILANRYRRVAPDAPGLTGAWIYDRNRLGIPYTVGQLLFADLSVHGRHGGVWNVLPEACDSPGFTNYRVLTAVGDKYRVGRDVHPCGDWAHLAAVYEQSWALRFDGSSWAEAPDADQLDAGGDLTIEVFAKIDAIGARQGLVSKGGLGDGAGGSVPYQLAVRTDGKLEFVFEEPGPVVKRVVSSSAITAGFHRISVVRKAGRTTKEVKGTRSFPVTDASGTATHQSVEVVERVDVEEWQDISFTVDGTNFGTSRYTGPGPRGNDGPLEVGRAREGTASYGLTGTIGEVRIWGKARETAKLGTPLQPRDDGLLARWTFEENEGNTTADLVGGNALKLRRARWAADPDPLASEFLVYRNGRSIACDTPATSPLSDWGNDQLTLGAVSKTATFSEFFDGTLEEVRLWRTARTPEQLLDSLFTRLKGDKQDLLAYWPFDGESTTATAESVRDHSLRGNHLALGSDATRPRVVLSTAPVSTDTATVRSAVAGVLTPFHGQISAPPAATEYADLQYTRGGEAYGVLKRAYAHIDNGTWHLTTGYKVGDLISEWVSQIQFDPQLIGYIEGAPPVPSENLTGGTDPAGCSEVTFKQADEVTSTLSSARERSVDMAFSMSAGVEVDEEILTILAPLGFGTAFPAADITLSAKAGGSIEYSNGWTDETSVSQGTSTDRDTTATLTGAWEDPARVLNSAIGRRYVPANKGYALVQSETADVYALRLAHSGALVAYRMLPNPDIPKDWNIITFPLNPQYTKQGTLDGGVGFNEQGKVLDPAYPNASQRGEYSYFKPREAYAIKRRILRERQELENYYNTVSTETDASDPTADRAGKVLESFVGVPPEAPEKKAPTQSAGSFANRNIANTYVWTADGGFFAETTGTTDVVTQTTGGSYSVSGSATGSLEFAFGAFGVGLAFQFDASIGGGLTVTRQRSKEATRSNSLEVTCNPTRDLQKYENGQPKYDAAGKPVLVPGKVDAYRFMTFYLGQDTTHFDDFYNKVADPTWLTSSNDPNAAALRQARHSDRKPPCWRILHRVTFISRILPLVPPAGAPPVEGALRSVDVASNYELIRRLDPYVSTSTGSRAELAEATRTALSAHLPQLLPHAAAIGQFLADYYGVNE